MNEFTIIIPCWLSVKIDVMSRIIIFKHHAFEANIWITTPLFAPDNLSCYPIHTSFILIIFESNFLYWFTQCYSSMIFSHFLG